jgi:hypothetical protein
VTWEVVEESCGWFVCFAREPRARTFREEAGLGALSEDSLVESEDEVVMGFTGEESINDVEDGSGLALMEDTELTCVSEVESVVPSDTNGNVMLGKVVAEGRAGSDAGRGEALNLLHCSST